MKGARCVAEPVLAPRPTREGVVRVEREGCFGISWDWKWGCHDRTMVQNEEGEDGVESWTWSGGAGGRVGLRLTSIVCVAGPTTYMGMGGGVKSGSYGVWVLVLSEEGVDVVVLCVLLSSNG